MHVPDGRVDWHRHLTGVTVRLRVQTYTWCECGQV